MISGIRDFFGFGFWGWDRWGMQKSCSRGRNIIENMNFGMKFSPAARPGDYCENGSNHGFWCVLRWSHFGGFHFGTRQSDSSPLPPNTSRFSNTTASEALFFYCVGTGNRLDVPVFGETGARRRRNNGYSRGGVKLVFTPYLRIHARRDLSFYVLYKSETQPPRE